MCAILLELAAIVLPCLWAAPAQDHQKVSAEAAPVAFAVGCGPAVLAEVLELATRCVFQFGIIHAVVAYAQYGSVAKVPNLAIIILPAIKAVAVQHLVAILHAVVPCKNV